MTYSEALEQAISALDGCDGALSELETRCCEPSRSPDIVALAKTLREARSSLEGPTPGIEEGEAARSGLQNARARVRRLQAECCSADRMPYFTMILEDLAEAQRALDRAEHATG